MQLSAKMDGKSCDSQNVVIRITWELVGPTESETWAGAHYSVLTRFPGDSNTH